MNDAVPDRSYLAMLRDELAAYQLHVNAVQAQIDAGDDADWNLRRLSGWQWNVAQTLVKIAREEQRL